jgi:hypothetical protein
MRIISIKKQKNIKWHLIENYGKKIKQIKIIT